MTIFPLPTKLLIKTITVSVFSNNQHENFLSKYSTRKMLLLLKNWHDREILKSPNIIVDLSTSPFSSICLCLTYFNVQVRGAYTFKVSMSS